MQTVKDPSSLGPRFSAISLGSDVQWAVHPHTTATARTSASTKSKSPGLLTTVMSQDEGELTRLTERGSIAAAPCPATQMVTPSWGFINPELFPGAGEGLVLKGTFWGPSQESAQLQVCPPRYVGYHEEGTHQVFPNS